MPVFQGPRMGARLDEPIDVYKPVAANIGVVDGPLEYLTVAGVSLPMPFPTRMTVVRLSSGDLFLHSPTRFDHKLASALASFGPVRHLVSPNQFHYAHIGEWLEAFPGAVAWASIRDWRPSRILLSHGRCFDDGTDDAIRRIFAEWS